MRFELVRPCPHCPFRTDVTPYLTPARAREIGTVLLHDQTFACHETTKFVEDDEHEDGGDMQVVSSSQHCAGALIMLEHMNRPNQLMRIFERLRAYDRRKLDMDAPVYRSVAKFVAAHRRRRRT